MTSNFEAVSTLTERKGKKKEREREREKKVLAMENACTMIKNASYHAARTFMLDMYTVRLCIQARLQDFRLEYYFPLSLLNTFLEVEIETHLVTSIGEERGL